MGKKSFFSILFVIIGIIAAGSISYFAVKENKRNKQIEGEIEILRQEAEKLRQNNQEMKERIVYFETSEFQEKVAKEKLNLQKDNENVAIIKPSPSFTENVVSQEKEEVLSGENNVQKQNYSKWWNYLFKY